MQTARSEASPQSSRRVMLVLMSLSTLYHYMYCMMVSSAFLLTPVFGGALMLTAQVGGTLVHLALGDGRKHLPKGMRAVAIVLLVFMLLCDLALLAVYPVLLNTYAMWILFTVVLTITLRASIARRLTGRVMRKAIEKSAFILLMALLEAAALGLTSGLMLSSLPKTAAWQMVGGFAAGALLEGYGLWRERGLMGQSAKARDIDPQTVRAVAHDMHEVHAYSSFQRFHSLILMALQMTLVMMYTFIGLTTDELLTCLLISVTLTLLLREATDFVLARMRKQAANQMLLIGLFLWIYGLILFYRQMEQAPNLLLSYLSLGLSVGGVTVAVTCLAELERQMTSVAQYGLENQLAGYAEMRASQTEMSILVGQMVALILLTVLCVPSGFEPGDFEAVVAGFRPLMIVPPLLLLAGAVVSVLRFPMNNRYFLKVARFLTLKDEGGENPALKKQLDNVVVKRHKNRYGVKLIITLLRPLYYHKVIGRENIAGYEDGTMILVCNHGELYGPVVANLYVPISFRPWVVSNMMEKEAIVEHMYQGTMMRQKWLPEGLKKPLIRWITPLFTWVFQSIEAIPVYRGNPRELIKTFRITMEAMQAGDNILLFPENGENRGEGEKGYAQEGVGDLYTGFAMLAPMYYSRTGKSAVFVPIYASKKLRTLTLGKGITFRPEIPVNEEKLRIVETLRSSMEEMYALERAETKRHNEKRRAFLQSRRRLSEGEREELEELSREEE